MITHHVETLDVHSNVAEWCPTQGRTDLLIVGTYQLNESTRTRYGRLYSYVVTLQDQPALAFNAQLDLPGVFDVSWNMLTDVPLLSVALSDGSVRLLQISENGFISEGASTPATDARLATCVDFGPHGLLCAGYSSGQVEVFQIHETGIRSLRVCEAHAPLETWAVSWMDDPGHPNASGRLFLSGGDDAGLTAWDLRQEDAVWTNRKEHQAGVCCIVPSRKRDFIFCTGSYDECLRVWDVRMAQKPLQRLQGLGGGVWRMAWRPGKEERIVAACMHAGFSIIDVADDCELLLTERYPHQQTLAYGCSWHADGDLIATASFYDNLLHLWSPSHPQNTSRLKNGLE